MLRRELVGERQNAVAEAAAADFYRVRLRTGGGEVFCLGMVADAERGHVFLILVEFVVEIRPVAALGSGDAACAARAHAVVEVAVVFGVNGGAGGDARQHFGGRGFIASVAQAEVARRCRERGDDGKGAVLVGDDAARERGGEVGAAAALLYGKDGAVGGAVQGEQVGILAAQAVEQCGNGGGDGGGGAEAKSGVDVAVDGDIEAAGGRVLPQRGDEKA